jgi:translation initiation factor 2B subunit (eIF-2B alpha/beta/delta family)
VVEKVLVKAHQAGKFFSVIIVDSGPLFEGAKYDVVTSIAHNLCISI